MALPDTAPPLLLRAREPDRHRPRAAQGVPLLLPPTSPPARLGAGLRRRLAGSLPARGSSLLEEDAATHTGAPPTTHDPVSGPAQLVAGLWSTYGPGLLASGAALLTQAQASAAQAAANANASAQASRGSRSRGGAADRRKQLEAELASLGEEPAGYDVSSATSSPAFVAVQMPSPDNGSSSKSAFEEVDVPSDMEQEGGHPVSPRTDQKRTSWFGWGGAAAGAGAGYERVKDE